MPLTITPERYQEIRRKVMERRLAAKAAEIVHEPGEMTFGSVDEFMSHLDALTEPESEPRQSRRKPR
jgi:hypothetical protein